MAAPKGKDSPTTKIEGTHGDAPTIIYYSNEEAFRGAPVKR